MTELEKAMADISKKAKGRMIDWFSAIEYPPVDVVSTGSLTLDQAIRGGIPRGRITALWGNKGCGKTTICYHLTGNAQKAGLTVCFIDTEFSFDPDYAVACGVDVDKLLWLWTFDKKEGDIYPAEKIWGNIETLMRTGEVGFIIIDSLDMLVPVREVDGTFGEANVGVTARLNAQAMRKLMGVAKSYNCGLVGTSQIRTKIGQMFGNPNDMGGGNALKHALSLRIDLYPTGVVKSGDEEIGRKSNFRVTWNKTGPPGRRGSFEIIYGLGIDQGKELLQLGVEAGVIGKQGAYYYIGEERLAHGENNAVSALLAQPSEKYKEILECVINYLKGAPDDRIEGKAEGDTSQSESGEPDA